MKQRTKKCHISDLQDQSFKRCFLRNADLLFISLWVVQSYPHYNGGCQDKLMYDSIITKSKSEGEAKHFQFSFLTVLLFRQQLVKSTTSGTNHNFLKLLEILENSAHLKIHFTFLFKTRENTASKKRAVSNVWLLYLHTVKPLQIVQMMINKYTTFTMGWNLHQSLKNIIRQLSLYNIVQKEFC